MQATRPLHRLSSHVAPIDGALHRQPAAAKATTLVLHQPTVDAVTVALKGTGRDAANPGTGPATRSICIRQLRPEDADAYCAFGGRMTWRDCWHYPATGMPGSDQVFRDTAARQGQPQSSEHYAVGGEVRLVLVETRTEEYRCKVYEWEEIYCEGWYNWGESSPDKSTFGLSVASDFQGSGAGRALITRVLEVAEATGYGPSIMTLTVQDTSQRAWELYESVGFEFLMDEEMGEREIAQYPGRKVPPMVNRHYQRKLGGVYQTGLRSGGAAAASALPPTLLLYDEHFAGHDMGSAHPESAERFVACLAALKEAYGDATGVRWCSECSHVTEEQLLRVHPPEYIKELNQRLTRRWMVTSRSRWCNVASSLCADCCAQDADTSASPGTREAVLRGSGGVCAAVDDLMAGAARHAFWERTVTRL